MFNHASGYANLIFARLTFSSFCAELLSSPLSVENTRPFFSCFASAASEIIS